MEQSLLPETAREPPKTGQRPEEAKIEAWQPDSSMADCPLDQGGNAPYLVINVSFLSGGWTDWSPIIAAWWKGILPAYYYQCTHCQATECRIGGVDDHLAVCSHCRNLMLRLDYDLFSPYFEAAASTATLPAPRSLGQGSRK